MADGQVYVRVQASASTYSARSSSIGSGGAITGQVKITWSFNGGISGQYGWISPRGQISYEDGNIQKTNEAVALAYQGVSKDYLIQNINNCWDIAW